MIEEHEENHRRELERMKDYIMIKRQELEDEHNREMDILKLKVQIAEKASSESNSQHFMSSKPKLPKFDEDKDDMDLYLARFERFARTLKWKRDEWAMCLSTLLTGKGLQVYASMPDSDADGYDRLKVALLKQYRLTEERFRRKFREERSDVGETVFQFIARIRRYFERWIELAGADKTYESLKDFMIQEQYMSTCNRELLIFLKERVPQSIADTTKLAQQYLDAHECENDSLSRNYEDAPKAAAVKNQQMSKPPANQMHENYPPYYKRKQCYICKRSNHIAKNCYFRNTQTYSNDHRHERHNENKEYIRHGYENHAGPEESGKYQNQQQGASFVIIDGDMNEKHIGGEMNKTFVRDGLVNQTRVQVLRDTGCTTAAVKSSLVPDHQLTGEETSCVLADGTQWKFPLAKIHVETPYYTEIVEAMCIDKPMYELILGNIPGATKQPNTAWKMEAGAIVTRRRVRQKLTGRTKSQMKQKITMWRKHSQCPRSVTL